MNITDQITSLFKSGVITITIGASPNKMLFVQAAQGVVTGPAGTHMQVQHQAEADSLPECLNQISKQVEHANNLKAENLVVVPRARN